MTDPIQQMADAAAEQARSLALKILDIANPESYVTVRALAIVFAGLLVEADKLLTVHEFETGTMISDEERIKLFVDEVKEFATMFRAAQKTQGIDKQVM